MEKALKFLKDCGVFYLATADGDQPRVRPFGAVCGFEGRLYLITGNRKEVFDQLQRNPKIEISGMAGEKWIRLAAEVARDVRREARTAMLDANPSLRNLYSEDDGVMEVFYLKDAVATVCSFTEAPETWRF